MLCFVALFAVSLSLGSPNDYFFTHPTNVPANVFMGKGIGPDGDYSMLRAEDLAFLDEAYAERCDVDFNYGSNSSFGRTATLPVVKIGGSGHRVPGTIFSEWDMACCFPLSCDPAMESTYPMAFILNPYGSHVTPDFRFRNPPAFAEVTGSVWQVEGVMGLRYVSGNVDWPRGGGLVSTNGFAYWGDDAAMTNSMSGRIPRLDIVKRLYGALDKFEYAVEWRTISSLTNLQYVYSYRRSNTTPVTYTESEYERPGGGVGRYYSGVETWATNTIDELESEPATFSTSITEYRRMIEQYNYSTYEVTSNQLNYVYFDDYVSENMTTEFHSVSNEIEALGFLSPVPTNSVTTIEIIGAALLVQVRRGRAVSLSTFSLGANAVYDTTNTVKRALMVVPCTTPTPVPGRIVSGRQMYCTSWAVPYIMQEVNREFGDISSENPPNLTPQPQAGVPSEYMKSWICQYVTSFTGTALYVFYRRIFNSVAH